MSDIEVSSREQASITAGLGEFPFRSEFSLAPLIRYWEKEVAGGCSVLGTVADAVLDQVRKAPELTAPVVDPAVVRANEDVLRALMLAVISPAFQEEGYAAALLPFKLQTFFATPAFTRDLTDSDGILKGRVQADASLRKQVADVRQFQLTLTPTARAKNEVRLSGHLDLSDTNATTGQLKLAADSLDVTSYYDLFAGEKKTPEGKPAVRSAPQTTAPPPTDANQEPEPTSLPFRNFTAGVEIGHFYLRELELANLQATARIDRGHVVLDPCKLALNGAPVATTLDLDLGVRGYKYALTLNARAPIARVLADPTLLAVPASAPWKTLQEFVDDAKQRPGQIPYGSSGPYGTLHVAMEMFAASAGIKLLHVPFRGAGPALTALLSGTVQAMLGRCR